jgi:hypothetical protein
MTVAKLFCDLPLDLIYHILVYTGIVKYRNGKYIDQIPKTDERYQLLGTIPRHRVCFINNKYILYVFLKVTSSHSKYMGVNYDFQYNLIEYCYCNLLKEGKIKYFFESMT